MNNDPTPEPKPMFQIHPGDWPEDFSHENGNYNCKCIDCGNLFTGHKRRVTCKVCATTEPVSETVEISNAVRIAVDFEFRDQANWIPGHERPSAIGAHVQALLDDATAALRRELEEVKTDAKGVRAFMLEGTAKLVQQLEEVRKDREIFKTQRHHANERALQLESQLEARTKERDESKSARSNLIDIHHDQMRLLADQRDNALAELERVRADNAKLRQLVGEEWSGDAADKLLTDVDQLRAEADRLSCMVNALTESEQMWMEFFTDAHSATLTMESELSSLIADRDANAERELAASHANDELVSTLRADIAAAHARLKAIYDATEGYADGAPDATAHDKLCNEISAWAKL